MRRSAPLISSSSVSFVVVVKVVDGGDERRRRPGQRGPVGGVRGSRSVARADAGPVDDLEADELAGEAREVQLGGGGEVGCLRFFLFFHEEEEEVDDDG